MKISKDNKKLIIGCIITLIVTAIFSNLGQVAEYITNPFTEAKTVKGRLDSNSKSIVIISNKLENKIDKSEVKEMMMLKADRDMVREAVEGLSNQITILSNFIQKDYTTIRKLTVKNQAQYEQDREQQQKDRDLWLKLISKKDGTTNQN